MVDDDELVLQSSVALLDDMGFSVIEAHSGIDALELLEHSPTVDLLLTDHAMPGMTGIQLADTVARLHPGLPGFLRPAMRNPTAICHPTSNDWRNHFVGQIWKARSRRC